jgi:hypothetical protein
MSKAFGFNRQFFVPACVGAALSYGVMYLTSDDASQYEQLQAQENQILALEQALAQKEDELADMRFFAATTASAVGQQQASELTPRPTAAAPKRQAQATELATVTSQQLLKDLSTQSERDPRTFSVKINDLLAGNASAGNIAIASKSVVDLADNPELLPDYELESLYQQQSNADVKRVAAQVMATRGDNRLLEQQIAATQTRLRSDNPAVRQQALSELAKTHYASAANAITPLLQDANTDVKLDALLALRATGNQNHLRAVQALANDPDPAVSWLARDVIKSLQNLSDTARTQLASADIIAELPVIPAP